MYTDENGIVRFESLDNIAPLQVGLNAALESVSDAFDSSVRIWPVANASERDALGVERPQRPLYVHRLDTGNLERNTGNGFEIVDQWQRPDGVLNGATGTVRMEPGSPNEVVSITIVFPEGLFSEAPALMSSIATTVPQQFPAQLGYSAIDEVSVTIYMLRTTSSAYTLRWGALGA